MVKLKGIIDTIHILDKYHLNYTYNEDTDTYSISDDDYQLILDNSKNKKYIENLKVGNGTTLHGPANRLDGQRVVSSEDDSSEIVFTESSLLDLLTKIDELKDYDIGLSNGLDGKIQLQVGESIYIIDDSEAQNIQVDNSAVEDIQNLNEETYENLEDNDQLSLEEPIESGIIKELAKTLLIGGLARLGKKWINE